MIKASDINESTPWQEMTVGGEIYEPATSRQFNTGDWRTQTPLWDSSKCRQCLLCAPFCPDCSIPVSGGKRSDFDYMHCKGCGICVKVCPFGAIKFEGEDA